MTRLTESERMFMEAVTEWMSEPETAVFLAGCEDSELRRSRNAGKPAHSMSTGLKKALIQAGVTEPPIDTARPSASQFSPAALAGQRSANDAAPESLLSAI